MGDWSFFDGVLLKWDKVSFYREETGEKRKGKKRSGIGNYGKRKINQKRKRYFGKNHVLHFHSFSVQ